MVHLKYNGMSAIESFHSVKLSIRIGCIDGLNAGAWVQKHFLSRSETFAHFHVLPDNCVVYFDFRPAISLPYLWLVRNARDLTSRSFCNVKSKTWLLLLA